MIYVLLISFIFALACLAFDAINTSRGLRAGVAVEGNGIIVAIAGNKPKLWQLLTIDGSLRFALLALALFLPTPDGLPAVWYATLTGAFVSLGLKNIRGGRQWRWLMRNTDKTLPQLNTIWQKLVGFWG